MQLKGKQLEAYKEATSNNYPKIFITGGAGTGKSFIINEIVGKLKRDRIPHEVLAPTNLAVKNLNEQVNIDEAKTLHKYFSLMKTENLEAKDEANFIVFDRFNLDEDLTRDDLVLIIDEASMIGANLLQKTIESIEASKVILVGDLNQLPPVKDKMVNWANYVDKVIELDINYRAKNEVILNMINGFRKTKSLNHIPVFTDVENKDNYYFIAHKNKSLSLIQKSLENRDYVIKGELARLHAPISKNGEIIYNNGEVVTVAERINWFKFETIFDNEYLLSPNDFKEIIDRFQKDLIEFNNLSDINKHLKVNNIYAEDKEINSNMFDTLTVISGNYAYYELLLNTNYALFNTVLRRLAKKYSNNVKTIWKLRKAKLLDQMDDNALIDSYRAYIKIKNTPYVRKANFLTTYKAQGQSLENVVVYEPDLINNPTHAYIAISRAMNKLYKIKR